MNGIGIAEPVANENFVIRNGSKSVLATYRAGDAAFIRMEKAPAYGIKPRNAEQSFALSALTNPAIKLVTLVGKAGTGKTLLALAAALECRSTYRQILLAPERHITHGDTRPPHFLLSDDDSVLDLLPACLSQLRSE